MHIVAVVIVIPNNGSCVLLNFCNGFIQDYSEFKNTKKITDSFLLSKPYKKGKKTDLASQAQRKRESHKKRESLQVI